MALVGCRLGYMAHRHGFYASRGVKNRYRIEGVLIMKRFLRLSKVRNLFLTLFCLPFLSGCLSFAGDANKYDKGWVVREVALIAKDNGKTADGGLKIALQYDITYDPAVYNFHYKTVEGDRSRQPQHQLIDVPAGERIVIESPKMEFTTAEDGTIVIDRTQVQTALGEKLDVSKFRYISFTNDAQTTSGTVSKRGSSEYSDGLKKIIAKTVNPDQNPDIANLHNREYMEPSEALDVSAFATEVANEMRNKTQTESNERAEELKKRIAELDSKYPMTDEGLSNYRKDVNALRTKTMLKPELTVLDDAINKRTNEVTRIMTTFDDVAQAGTYTFTLTESNILELFGVMKIQESQRGKAIESLKGLIQELNKTWYVALMPNGEAASIGIMAGTPVSLTSRRWRKSDKGFGTLFGPGGGVGCHIVKQGNVYKATLSNNGQSVVVSAEFNPNKFSAGTYTSINDGVRLLDGKYGVFNIKQNNTADVAFGGQSLGTWDWTVADNVLTMKNSQETVRLTIAGNRFLFSNNMVLMK
jgi:hypothetical protein